MAGSALAVHTLLDLTVKTSLPQTTIAAAVALSCLPFAQAQTASPEAVQTLQPITVTGSTIDDRFGDDARAPVSTTVITGRQIESEHATNMVEVLRAIPGLTVETQGGDDLKIKFRGVENQRYMGEKPGVAIVIDGVPVFERTGKVNINLDNIESIKIIKGGASYLFGEDALSGAVIITTKRGAANKGVTLEMDRGAYGYERDLVRVGGAGDNWTAHIQASHRASDDWHYQSNYKSDGLTGNLQWMPTEQSVLTLGLEDETRFRDKHGTVTGQTQATVDPKGVFGRDYARHFDVDLQKANLTFSEDFSAASNLLTSIYQYKDHTMFWSSPQKFSADGRPVTASDAYNTLNDYHQKQRGAKAEFRDSLGRLAYMVGGEIKRNEYLNFTSAKTDYRSSPVGSVVTKGTVFSDDATDENVEALYGELRFAPVEKWEITANARHDRITLDYQAKPVAGNGSKSMRVDRSFDANSFRLGASWSGIENTTLFGNVSTGFRVPTVDQLYRGSQTISTSVANNPNLKPEKSVNLEFGLRRAFRMMERDASLQATVFQIDRDDFILDTNGQYSGNDAQHQSRYENIGGARSRGLELALKSSFSPSVDWDLAYTYLDSYFTRYEHSLQSMGSTYGQPVGSPSCQGPSINWNACYQFIAHNNTGNQVPRTPPHALNLRSGWRFAEGWKLTGEMDYRDDSWADEINQVKWKGRTIFNMSLDHARKLPWLGQGARMTAFIKVENVFDRLYYTIARGTNDSQSYSNGFKYDGVYNAEDLSITVDPGRIWRAGISVSF